jgi:hypothetical protein
MERPREMHGFKRHISAHLLFLIFISKVVANQIKRSSLERT